MQVWDACSDAIAITFKEDHLSDELAYIVENDLVLHAVNTQLFQKENVTVIHKSKITDVKLHKHQPNLPLYSWNQENGTQLDYW
ncbi:hypothetical protein CAJAP_07448 [Camponotus japonicus]